MSEGETNQNDLELIEFKKETKLDDSYEILGPIGSGGMGSVTKARHKILGQLVAIKRISDTKTTDQNALRRFVNEAKAASRLKHENLVSIHDFGIDQDGIPFAIMDFAAGKPLSDLIETSGTLSPARTINIAIEIAKGLEHAHKLGVVHRDIKPSNVIVRTNDDIGEDKAVIVDFGLAKIEDPTGQKITQTGEVYGSPLYISPEQAIGMPIDLRTDIYSLGCVIFECLAGVPPFVGDNAMQTAMKHMQSEPPKLSASSQVALPAGLETIVDTCLQKDAANRYQTASALLQALYAVQRGEKISMPAQSKPRSFLRSKVFWALNAVLLVVLATTYFLSSPNKSPTGTPLAPQGGPVSDWIDSLPISAFAKEAVREDMDASMSLFTRKEYLKSAIKLTSSTDILKKELKALEQKQEAASSKREKAKLSRDHYQVKMIIMENLSHIGKCFLHAKQYSESLPYFEESLPFFREDVRRRNSVIPSVHEVYQDYLTALDALGDKAKADEIRAQYESDKSTAK